MPYNRLAGYLEWAIKLVLCHIEQCFVVIGPCYIASCILQPTQSTNPSISGTASRFGSRLHLTHNLAGAICTHKGVWNGSCTATALDNSAEAMQAQHNQLQPRPIKSRQPSCVDASIHGQCQSNPSQLASMPALYEEEGRAEGELTLLVHTLGKCDSNKLWSRHCMGLHMPACDGNVQEPGIRQWTESRSASLNPLADGVLTCATLCKCAQLMLLNCCSGSP